MPRASWRGFLRLSLVSCPIYLSPATSRTKPIRLHQVWRPASVEEPEDGFSDQVREKQLDDAVTRAGYYRPAFAHRRRLLTMVSGK